MVSVENLVGDEDMDEKDIVIIEQEDAVIVEEPLLGQITLDEILAELRLS